MISVTYNHLINQGYILFRFQQVFLSSLWCKYLKIYESRPEVKSKESDL